MTVTPASIVAPLTDALEAVLRDRFFWRRDLDPLKMAAQAVKGLVVECTVALADDRDRLVHARIEQADPSENRTILSLTCDVIDQDETVMRLNVYDNAQWITLSLEIQGIKMRVFEVHLRRTQRIVDACLMVRATHEDMQKRIATGLLRTVLTTLLALCGAVSDAPATDEAERLVQQQGPILDALLAVAIDALPETLKSHGPMPIGVSRQENDKGEAVLVLASPHSNRHPVTEIALTPFFAGLLPPFSIRRARTSSDAACLIIHEPTERNANHQPATPVDMAHLVRRVPHDQVEIIRKAVRGIVRFA